MATDETQLMNSTTSEPGNREGFLLGRATALWSEFGWLACGALFVLVAIGSEAKKAETDAMRANRKAIVDMTSTERQRLKDNQEAYQQLSHKRKQEIKAIHERVSADKQLADTLDKYHRWLSMLPPVERQRILDAPAHERLDAIESNIDTPIDGPFVDSTHSDSRPGVRQPLPFWMRMQGGTALPESEFAEMIDAIAHWLQLEVRPQSDQRLDVIRYRVQVVDAMVERVGRPAQFDNANANGPKRALPDSLIRVIVNSVAVDKRRRVLQQLKTQPMAFLQVIVRSLGRNLTDALDANRANVQELEEFFRQIPEGRRKDLEKMDKTTRETIVKRMWLEHRHRDIMLPMKRITQFLNGGKMQPRPRFRQPTD